MGIDFATIDFGEFDLSTKEGRERLKAELGKLGDGNEAIRDFRKMLIDSLDSMDNLSEHLAALNKVGSRASTMKAHALELAEELYEFGLREHSRLIAMEPHARVNTRLFYDLGRAVACMRSAGAMLGIAGEACAKVLGQAMSDKVDQKAPTEPPPAEAQPS